jgi:hypothetical protein
MIVTEFRTEDLPVSERFGAFHLTIHDSSRPFLGHMTAGEGGAVAGGVPPREYRRDSLTRATLGSPRRGAA